MAASAPPLSSYPAPHPQQVATPDSMIIKVELFFECRNLKNMDLLSKSDPCVVVYAGYREQNQQQQQQQQQQYNARGYTPSLQWREVGRTEMIKDNLNPTFQRSIRMDYHFEQVQPLRFLVIDIDNPNSTSVADADQIGVLETTLGEIAGCPGQRITRDLEHPTKKDGSRSNRGSITVKLQEVCESVRDNVELRFRGVKLAKKDLFTSDPYFIIKRITGTTTDDMITVYRSETIKRTLNPKWNPVRLPMSRLSPTGNMQERLQVEVWDWDRISSDDLIGIATTTIEDLQNRVAMTLVDKKGKGGGTVVVEHFHVEKVFSFLDYIGRGCEIELVVAIDWTGSNGSPSDPRSLHYFDPHAMNQYEQVIRSVGDILGYYDRDQMFPTFGFGGKLPNGQVSHCFALNGSPAQPECHGINGVLNAYRQALSNVQLYGPTYFHEIIQACSVLAREALSSGRQSYLVLLIITDGVINDMQKTTDAIVEAADLPMSIVIVGVGNADFSNMDELDGDEVRLRSSSGRQAARDIVQFVPFNRYRNMPYEALAREVLAEIPDQLTEFFSKKGIRPIGM